MEALRGWVNRKCGGGGLRMESMSAFAEGCRMMVCQGVLVY